MISDLEVFIALFLALVSSLFAIRLGVTLYV
jgi:photosystem I reaction center subunit XII